MYRNIQKIIYNKKKVRRCKHR